MNANDEKTKEQKLADDLMIWLPKLSAGKTLERSFVNNAARWTDVEDIHGLANYITHGCEIRIKQIQFPAAPDGEVWHNPDNLTAEQVGVEDGWRLLLVSEAYLRDLGAQIVGQCAGFRSIRWNSSGHLTVNCPHKSYRVKTADYPVGSLKPKKKKPDYERILIKTIDGKLHWLAAHTVDAPDEFWTEYSAEELTEMINKAGMPLKPTQS